MNTKSVSHSPGPWKVEYNEAIYAKSTYGQPDLRVADVCGEDTPQREANARLVSAAPDLLEALIELVAEFSVLRPAQQTALNSYRKALKAISKVEGQQ